MPPLTPGNRLPHAQKLASSTASANGTGRDPVDDLLLLVENFALSPSFLELKNMRHDLLHERESSRRTEIAYDRNLVELNTYQVQLKQQKEQLDKAITDRQAVQSKLQAQLEESAAQAASIKEQDDHVQRLIEEVESKDQRIATLEMIREERDAIKIELATREEQLASTTAALHTVQEQLDQLQAFRVNMPQMDDGKRETICQILDANFQDAYRFMEQYLDQDLEESLLNNHLAWEDMRNHASIQHITPLCASNSRAARRMRVAAGLAAYGKALDRYVFKPVYMTSSSDEIDHMLSALWKEDPAHEFFVRSVLLKVLPQAQNKKKQARVREAAEHVHKALDLFIGAPQREHFKAGLEVLCDNVCEAWMQIQLLQERVRTSFSFGYHGVWRPLPESPLSSLSTTPSASQNNNNNNNNNTDRSEAGQQPRRQDVGKVVWPSFLYHHPQDEDEDEELLLPGYLLTDAQTADAENEEESPRRLARRSTRNKEQAGGKKRRDSGIFLSSTTGCWDASGTA
ncbi:hypothetical protein E4U42_006159 [Claviceps africana]|uniref:MEI5 protein n=1 Tax=Claviceps africana TaxID=83212 RepID=A0A8K0NGY4_9HYPO|nr:hypothetical protein E4U42_006159 [Claviceps africana]